MDLGEQVMLAARALRLGLRRLPCVRGRGRLESLLFRAYRGRRTPVVCRTAHGAKMLVDPTDPAVQRAIWEVGEYEAATSRLLLRILRPDDIFYDVGAHIGYYNLLVGRAVPAGYVVAIEPNPALHGLLRHNVAANGLTNVITRQRAVWSSSGMSLTLVDDCAPNTGSLQTFVCERPAASAVTVQTVTVDDLARETDQRPTIIKLDVEGAELEALRGAAEVLSQDRPPLVVEYNNVTASAFGYSARDIFEHLQQAYAYRFFIHGHGKAASESYLQPIDAAAGDCRDFENVICIHPLSIGERDWPITEVQPV